MSKTFKALQRAAAEQARRLQRETKEPPAPLSPAAPPPTAAMARLFAVSEPPRPAPAAPTAGGDGQALRSEMDTQLRELLESSFRPGCPELLINDDGWVAGRLDREALLALRRRHALLHCLRKSERESFWFWGSGRDAAALAAATGYELDGEEPAP